MAILLRAWQARLIQVAKEIDANEVRYNRPAPASVVANETGKARAAARREAQRAALELAAQLIYGDDLQACVDRAHEILGSLPPREVDRLRKQVMEG